MEQLNKNSKLKSRITEEIRKINHKIREGKLEINPIFFVLETFKSNGLLYVSDSSLPFDDCRFRVDIISLKLELEKAENRRVEDLEDQNRVLEELLDLF
jgi:hypothetical protein